MKSAVGIRALAISVPSVARTNDYYRKRYPAQVADAERAALARLWKRSATPSPSTEVFDAEMAPYLADPFRGTVQRRILGKGETPMTLEVQAARDVLAAASMGPNDLDCLMVTSFLPDQVGIGNSAFLAGALEFKGAAWNVETACTSTQVALQTAASLVRAGEYRNVLVVVSCTYSRVSDETDTLTWFMGDAGGAFLVGPMPEGQGVLGTKILNTAATCNTFYYDIDTPPEGKPRIRIHAHERTGKVLRETAEPFLVECCDGALKAAGMTRKDVDYLVVNTPTAWYAKFCARALGISTDRVMDTHPRYGNVGPALMSVNLYHAAREGRIREGDVVLAYTVGSASSAGAAVMRWGDVKLGPEPREALTVE